MKLVCQKDKILKALNSVIKAVATKTTMPILEGILIRTNDNEIKLTKLFVNYRILKLILQSMKVTYLLLNVKVLYIN